MRLEAQAKDDSAKRKADAVIMVWLAGGPATIDMWDLKPGAPDGIRGEFRPAATSADGVQISEHLPLTGRIMNKCTVVRSLALQAGDELLTTDHAYNASRNALRWHDAKGVRVWRRRL